MLSTAFVKCSLSWATEILNLLTYLLTYYCYVSARDARLFTVLEELRSDLSEVKGMIKSLQRRVAHGDVDNTASVLQELQLPMKEYHSVDALEEKLEDKSYEQSVVSQPFSTEC